MLRRSVGIAFSCFCLDRKGAPVHKSTCQAASNPNPRYRGKWHPELGFDFSFNVSNIKRYCLLGVRSQGWPLPTRLGPELIIQPDQNSTVHSPKTSHCPFLHDITPLQVLVLVPGKPYLLITSSKSRTPFKSQVREETHGHLGHSLSSQQLCALGLMT